MNFVFLSPHFPPNFFNFCTALDANGVRVLGIGDAAFDELRPELRNSLIEYYRVGNMNLYDEAFRACGYLIHRHGRLDRVESHNEHWLTLEGKLREDFNIPGPKGSDIWKIKRKSLMKEVFTSVGVKSGRGMLYKDLESTLKFIGEIGYPIIAKPDIGVGGWGTYKISDRADLDNFLNTRPQVEYFIEEFIDGELFTFDGIADQEGKAVYYTSHHAKTGVFELVVYNDDLNYYSLREIPEDVLNAGLKSVKGFNIREKFFHFEFFRRKSDGELFAIELNCRPPGGFSTDMMNFACDIDVYREWANVIVFNKFLSPIERKYHCAHIARKTGKNYAISHAEVLRRWGRLIVAHMPVARIFSAVMGNYAYLVRSPDLAEVKDAIFDIQRKM